MKSSWSSLLRRTFVSLVSTQLPAKASKALFKKAMLKHREHKRKPSGYTTFRKHHSWNLLRSRSAGTPTTICQMSNTEHLLMRWLSWATLPDSKKARLRLLLETTCPRLRQISGAHLLLLAKRQTLTMFNLVTLISRQFLVKVLLGASTSLIYPL